MNRREIRSTFGVTTLPSNQHQLLLVDHHTGFKGAKLVGCHKHLEELTTDLLWMENSLNPSVSSCNPKQIP